MQSNKSFIIIIISLVLLTSGLAYLNFSSAGNDTPIEKKTKVRNNQKKKNVANKNKLRFFQLSEKF